MTQHVTAIYEKGVLKPLGSLDLREQELVSLSIEKLAPLGAEGSEEAPTLFDVLNKAGLVGCVKDAPSDLSSNPKYMEGFGRGGE
jgi:predicted DNA-binding antitoxin AbrB/MazE fold protein